MNSKFFARWFRFAFALPALTLLAGTVAEAAPIGLSVIHPDVTIGGALVNYMAPICVKSSGGGPSTGICNATNYSGALVTPGMLTLTDPNNVGGNSGAMFYTGDGNVNAGFYGDFNLTAYFNGNGIFGSAVTAGSTTYTSALSLVMTNGSVPNVGSAPPNFTIITANLGTFGFSGSGSGGVLEFAAGNSWGGSVTGGYWDLRFDFSGTIAGTTIGTGAPASGVSWDADTTLFKRNWNGTASVNTFVPIPATLWLFGSGLAALAGIARRRRA